jgi:N-methylhydantoinase A/oxoprolinase/acetone carboxylase beta subunit
LTASDAQPRRSALAVKDRFEEEIAHAIRRHAGIDLEGASLLALGGGGGLHAASIAGKLGLREVRAFPFSPVFGAFGSSTLDVVHVYQASLRGRGARANALELGDWFRELVAAAWRDVEDEGFSPSDVEFELVIERISSAPEQVPSLVRLPVTAEQGQILLPAGGTDPEMAWLRARVALTHRTDPHRLVWEPRGERMLGARNVDWGESPVPTDVFRLEGLGGESHLCGPCLVESQFTTLAVPPGWSFLLEPSGWMHLRV